MRVDSIQSVIHTLLDRVILERVFYGRDEHTGASVTRAVEYTIQIYNQRGQIVEQSQPGSRVDVRA